MYGSRLSSTDCVEKNAIAFGQQVKQSPPNDYLKTSVPDEHGYPNQFSYSRFRVEASENLPPSTSQLSDGGEASGAAGNFFTSPPNHTPIAILDSEELRQDVASEVSVKPEKANSGGESEIKIVQVWSMAIEEGSHIVNNSPQNSNIQTSPIIQADNLANDSAHKRCTQNNAKIRYQRNHSGEKPYKCKDCDKGFALKATLKKHQRLHSGEKPYKCKDCDRGFAQKATLKTHQRLHSGEKPYKCKDCDKCFAQTNGLLIHRSKHTGKRPHQCQQCVKSFTQKCDLNAHQRIHTGERPFECEQCNRSFTQKSHLKKHQHTHTAEKSNECKQCGKCFGNKSSLKAHQRIHTGQMLHNCSLCDMSFSRRCYLREHQHIHTGFKPYACCQCDKRFTRKSYLKVHQLLHAAKSIKQQRHGGQVLILDLKPPPHTAPNQTQLLLSPHPE